MHRNVEEMPFSATAGSKIHKKKVPETPKFTVPKAQIRHAEPEPAGLST